MSLSEYLGLIATLLWSLAPLNRLLPDGQRNANVDFAAATIVAIAAIALAFIG